MKIKIPWLAFSALIFYLGFLLLVYIGFLPSSDEIFLFLNNLYDKYWILGLTLASFLEGIVYMGLYFPGSTIIAISVILSDGKYSNLFWISLIIALTLTLTSVINYYLGYYLLRKRLNNNSGSDKSLILSCLYPNVLAFYFFNLGLEKRKFHHIFLVPLIMLPYGFLLTLLIYSIKPLVVNGSENPFIMIGAILIWFFIALYLKNRRKYPEFR